MRRGLGPGVAAVFLALLVLRRVVVRDSSHLAHGVLRVLIVAVAVVAIAAVRLFVGRR
jgi:hypothetical protein